MTRYEWSRVLPKDRGQVVAVKLICPECGWESREVPHDPEKVNGVWYALQEAGDEYRAHRTEKHRGPMPVRRFLTDEGREEEAVKTVELEYGPYRVQRTEVHWEDVPE